ncbi:hypothetical protein [Streptomyces sp. NPDC049949]|uniref:hypothetical protein n=1 Tax=Streptomyces sp. NPDC049949 TaxID=3154627 RepID=UPI00343EAC37
MPVDVRKGSTATSDDSLSAELESHAPADDSSPDDARWMVDVAKLQRVRWDDGNAVADLVFEKMNEEQRTVLLERLLAAHEG